MPRVQMDLPHFGESVTEATILRWLKKPGERVEKYEPMVEVETDKVTTEIPAPHSGVVVRLLAEEGQRVPMGTPILEMETEEAAETPAPAEAPPPAEAPAPQGPAEPARRPAVWMEEAPVHMGPTGVLETEEPAPAEAREEAPRAPRRLSPVVRRLVAEHGITEEELARIQGTGMGGRITKEDILQYIARRTAPAPAPAPTSAPAPTPAPPAVAPGPDEEWEPVSPVRRRIAENMVRSVREIPHASATVEVDMTRIARWREAVREEFRRREGIDLTYLPFIVKAVVEALKEHPRVNSSWAGDHIVIKKRIHIGIAVAAPQGLVVPVLHDADRYSIAGLARALHDLIERARTNRLRVEDVQGGTFTINNTGALGAIESGPIINYPQTAILATNAVVKRPVVVEGDAIAIRHMMNLTVVFDHRVLDGHDVSAFQMAIKRRLEGMGPENTPLY